MNAEASVSITNPTGLHARPAVKLSQLAARFAADVEIRLDGEDDWVSARSTSRVMKLKATAASTVHFRAEGPQAGSAVKALVDLVKRDFDEQPEGVGETGEARDGRPAGDTPDEGDGRRIAATVASRGLAVGVLHRLGDWSIGGRAAGDAEAELAALEASVERALEQLRELAERAGGLAADVIAFQTSLLEDDEFLEQTRSRIRAGKAADRAWNEHLRQEIDDCESADTAYLRDRGADLRDLRDRVAMALVGATHEDALPEGAIVVLGELTPSRFLQLDWSRAVGVATLGGSSASHTAMLARARGVPMLVEVDCEPGDLEPGVETILDAERGCLVLEPAAASRDHCARRMSEKKARKEAALLHAAKPARTRSGVALKVLVNVDDPSLLSETNPEHCDGIGLTRTEFLFHGDGVASELPDEETQFRYYSQLLEWAQGRPVTVRTLDAGGDKPIPSLTREGESNPFLGLRGVRLSLARPDVLRVQLRALARAAAHGDLKVVVPMVTLPSELDAVRELLDEEVEALGRAGVKAARPSLGMMVEVPGAAMTLDAFRADFYSLGTNDLAQYLFASARDVPEVGALADPVHPAMLELIGRAAEHGLRTGKEVSVCGEMASVPEYLATLVALGIRALSVPPAALALTKAALAKL